MDEPWTTKRGPVASNEVDIRKAEAINALLVRPIGILPAVPGDPIRPFAIGLFDDIRLLIKPDIGITVLRRAVGAFVHSKRYYLASALSDAFRHDIDGMPVEPVSASDRLVAQRRFLSLKHNNGQTATPAPEPAPPPAPSKADQIRAGLLSRNRQARHSVS
ncbi:ProQ/FINO family protein [Rhizobium terrae]|uniref:ProQ/FINO family protein n=1 Tax=Rhizobium terrae TaxID=2171756 RepID=UPI000E3EA3F4|nr:ProQ/FINO family protein [Rhizobium terrae]